MKNFPIIDKETGREYWISRSVCVVILVKVEEGDDVAILATKRGKGTPDPEYVNTWCLPCGYVEFDETIKEAAARELFEETGLDFLPEKFKLVSINDNPKGDKRQNITFRFLLDLSDYSLEQLCEQLTPSNSEPDEVSDIIFIPVWQIPAYKWAFNHEQLCQEILNHDCLQDFPN